LCVPSLALRACINLASIGYQPPLLTYEERELIQIVVVQQGDVPPVAPLAMVEQGARIAIVKIRPHLFRVGVAREQIEREAASAETVVRCTFRGCAGTSMRIIS